MYMYNAPITILGHYMYIPITILGNKDMAYVSRHQEAVKIFNGLLSQETLADPISLVRNILETCYDITDLQSEVGVSFGIIKLFNIYIIHI